MGDTKSLAEVIQQAIEAKLLELNTAMPCEVVKVDLKKGMCDVQPSFKKKFITQKEAIDLPVITNVPIAFPRTKFSYLKLPVAKGDTGQIIFNQRSIDGWILSGGTVDPKTSRRHALSDATFYPGMSPITSPLPATGEDTDLELGNGLSNVTLKKNGKIKIGNGVIDNFALIKELIEILQAAVTATSLGPQPLDPATQTKLVTLLGKLNQVRA